MIEPCLEAYDDRALTVRKKEGAPRKSRHT